jgi:hypothetical protein
MRAIRILALAPFVVSIGCRRDRTTTTTEIKAEPPAPSSNAPEPTDVLAVREIFFDNLGPFEVHVSYPRVTLPSGAGKAISTSLEDEVRRRAQGFRDRFDATPHTTGAYRLRCFPDVVATELVGVTCRGSVKDATTEMDLVTYAWTVDGAEPRRLSLDDVVGAKNMVTLATELARQLSRQLGKSPFPPKDLVDRHALDHWFVRREGLGFDFLPGVASTVYDELYGGIDWTMLAANTQDAALVARMKAATTAPDTIFGYPVDAGK